MSALILALLGILGWVAVAYAVTWAVCWLACFVNAPDDSTDQLTDRDDPHLSNIINHVEGVDRG